MLQLVRGRILCAECRLAAHGMPTYERHHPAGRSNDDFVVPLPGNEHAVMSDSQEDWAEETLRNPRRDILHRDAAWDRAEADLRRRLTEQATSRARVREVLALYLDEKLGPGWPQDFESWREKQGL